MGQDHWELLVDMSHLHTLPCLCFWNKQTGVLRPLCFSLQWTEILISWLSSQTEMTLCVSTSTTSQGPFSTWSETPNQVRTKRKKNLPPKRPKNNCANQSWLEGESQRLLFPQASRSTVRSSEISRYHPMVSSTPTSAALVSSTRLWEWGWWSARRISPSSRTGSGSR